MTVIVGSARHDEIGKTRGGVPGDQTGHEVETQAWYLHKKGWIVIRPKDPTAREKIAKNMEAACANPHIGYSQSDNYALFNEAKKYGFDCSKVKKNVNTDCSRTVRVCCWYAGIEVPVFYTGTQVEILDKTGQFTILTDTKYTTKPDYLLRGDILVTKTTGHTVVVLNDGPKADTIPPCTRETIKKKSSGTTVRELQELLNLFGYKDAAGNKLMVDGKFGAKTEAALMSMQKDQSLAIDGVCGPRTWARLDEMEKGIRDVKLKSNSYLRSAPATSAKRLRILKGGNIYRATRGKAWVFLSGPDGWVPGKKLEYL